jgi:hypothetical protein
MEPGYLEQPKGRMWFVWFKQKSNYRFWFKC